MEASIPNCKDERGVTDGEGAGEMHRIGAPQGVLAHEVTGVTLDSRCQLNRPRSLPEPLPVGLHPLEATSVEIVVPVGGSESGSDLGVREPA